MDHAGTYPSRSSRGRYGDEQEMGSKGLSVTNEDGGGKVPIGIRIEGGTSKSSVERGKKFFEVQN